jgi:phosphoesterase RecJ-like protein
MLDTADLHNTGQMRDIICRAKDVFVVDHHEPGENSSFPGVNDSTAASTCELAVEFVRETGISLDLEAAFAAYTGIMYDTGFFAYQKTGARTFRAALWLLDLGVSPSEAYHQLCETKSTASLLLQKKALAGLTLHCENRVAIQILRQSDFAEAAALPEDTQGLVNTPLKAKNILVSLFFKETSDGKTRCSLRSKGNINVAKIAQNLGGGGHVNAAGFKSGLDIDKAATLALAMVARYLEKV